MSKPVLLVSACALVDADNRILLAQRPEGKSMAGLWEFPGGKVEDGETPEETLIRELKDPKFEEAFLNELQMAYESYFFISEIDESKLV